MIVSIVATVDVWTGDMSGGSRHAYISPSSLSPWSRSSHAKYWRYYQRAHCEGQCHPWFIPIWTDMCLIDRSHHLTPAREHYIRPEAWLQFRMWLQRSLQGLAWQRANGLIDWIEALQYWAQEHPLHNKSNLPMCSERNRWCQALPKRRQHGNGRSKVSAFPRAALAAFKLRCIPAPPLYWANIFQIIPMQLGWKIWNLFGCTILHGKW